MFMPWVDEREPFPAFLRSCHALELVKLQHEARAAGDEVTLRAVLLELKRRDEPTKESKAMTDDPRLTLAPGIYRIVWRDGSESVAAVGVGVDGVRWIAPSNWVHPALSDPTCWASIKSVQRIE